VDFLAVMDDRQNEQVDERRRKNIIPKPQAPETIIYNGIFLFTGHSLT
jgi:hypothetical protein